MEDKTKIAILLGGLNTGGAERVAVSFFNYLIKRKKNVELLFILFNKNNSLYELDKKIKVIEIISNKGNGVANFFHRKKELKKIFELEKPDIIFTFFEKTTLYSLLSKNTESALISSDRANINYRSLMRRILCRYTAKRCDGYIFQTESAKKCYGKKVQRHSTIIPNAVSTYAKECRNKKNIISAMGRLTWQKGFDVLIKAYAIFNEKHNDYILNIYGDGPDFSSLKDLINSLNLNEKVNLLGNRRDAIDDISESKLFVLSSRFEGMPNALLEAMASGVACISTDCPFGPNEIIENGKNGILVQVDDVEELAKNLEKVLCDDTLRKGIEEQAIKIREKYSSSAIYEKYYEYLMNTLYRKKNKKSFLVRVLKYLKDRRLLNFLSDKQYIKLVYYIKFGKKMNLKKPQTLNEKLNWLKLHDRKEIYITMCDKYEAKEYIASIIGSEYIVPTLGIYDKFDDIDFDKLPNQFVIKCTHDSGGVIVVKDKKEFDIDAAREKINKLLRRNYFYVGREWPYKNIKPRILIEKYMVDESGIELKDYKIFCFNGKPEYVEVDFNRHIKHKLNTYDFKWKPLNFCDDSKNDYSANIPKPERLNDMKKIAEILSKNMDFLRVDFYSVYDKIYVGELTLYPGSGFINYQPVEKDLLYGKKLHLGGKENENI